MEQVYNHDLKVAYEMPFEGGEVIKFYELKHGDQEIPQGRFFMANVFEKFISLGFTPQMLDELIERLIKNVHSDKPSHERLQEVGVIAELMKSHRKSLINEEILLNIATIYYVMEHEPVAHYSYEWAETKRNLWSSNPDAKVFFCKMAYENTTLLQGMLWEDVEMLIRKSKQQSTILKNTLT